MIVYHGTPKDRVDKIIEHGAIESVCVSERLETAALYAARRHRVNDKAAAVVLAIDTESLCLVPDTEHIRCPLGPGAAWRAWNGDANAIRTSRIVDEIPCDVSFSSVSYAHYRYATGVAPWRIDPFPVVDTKHDEAFKRDDLNAYMKLRKNGPFCVSSVDAPTLVSDAWARQLTLDPRSS